MLKLWHNCGIILIKYTIIKKMCYINNCIFLLKGGIYDAKTNLYS